MRHYDYRQHQYTDPLLLSGTKKMGMTARNGSLCVTTKIKNLSLVALMLRIGKQFIHLAGWEAVNTPLAIYQSSDGTICYITSADINGALRATAAAVYSLNPAKHMREL